MAEGEHVRIGVVGFSSNIMYFNPLHAWEIGLNIKLVECTLEEIVVNILNDNKLGDVLRPIQKYNEFYWIQVLYARSDPAHMGMY